MTDKIKLDEGVAWELIHEIAYHIEELTITDEERKIADENCERSEEQGELYCDITDDVAQILINYFHIDYGLKGLRLFHTFRLHQHTY